MTFFEIFLLKNSLVGFKRQPIYDFISTSFALQDFKSDLIISLSDALILMNFVRHLGIYFDHVTESAMYLK